MKKRNSLIAGAIAAMCLGLPVASAGNAQFVDLDAPDAVTALGADTTLLLFRDAEPAGVRLHNAGKVEITVQDTVSLATLRLAPGMRIGLACDAGRHLALAVGDDIVYESVACGSLLRFTANTGGQQ